MEISTPLSPTLPIRRAKKIKAFFSWKKIRANLAFQIVGFYVIALLILIIIHKAGKVAQVNTNYISMADGAVELFLFVYLFNFVKAPLWKELMQMPIRVWTMIKLVLGGVIFKIVASIIAFIMFGLSVMQQSVEKQWQYISPNHPHDLAQTWALFMAVVVLGPIFEELLFRGLIFNRLQKRFSVLSAAMISSLLFGLAHVIPMLIVMMFLMGLFQCFIYQRYKNIWYTIGIHMFFNFLPFLFGGY